MAHGKTLRLFLVDGHPQGIVIAEVINWTVQVARVPRSLLSRYLQRPDSRRTGAYVLTGPDTDVPERLRVYVGESENVGERLRQHVLAEEKDFWDVGYAISSKDGNLTKSHALFLEALLRAKAIGSGRHLVENIKRNDYANVPESDRSDMLAFAEQVEIILSALGLNLSTPLRPTVVSEISGSAAQTEQIEQSRQLPLERPNLDGAIAVELLAEKLGVRAQGVELAGQVLVETGSTARKEALGPNSYASLRARLLQEGVLKEDPAHPTLSFTTDYLFDSPSAASAVILNRNDNGRQSWRVKDTGETLNGFYASQLASTRQPESDGL